MTEKVKCMVCGKVFTSKDALAHEKVTGHNSWEMIEKTPFDGIKASKNMVTLADAYRMGYRKACQMFKKDDQAYKWQKSGGKEDESEPDSYLSRFRMAASDAREGKPLDLSQDEYEVFWSIANLLVGKLPKSDELLLTPEEIGDNLDLGVEGEYPCSGGGITSTVSVDKLLKAQLTKARLLLRDRRGRE